MLVSLSNCKKEAPSEVSKTTPNETPVKPSSSYQQISALSEVSEEGCFNMDSLYESTLIYMKNGGGERYKADNFQEVFDYVNANPEKYLSSKYPELPCSESTLTWDKTIPQNFMIHLNNIVKSVGDEAAIIEKQYNDDSDDDELLNIDLMAFASNVNKRIDNIAGQIKNDESLDKDDKEKLLQVTLVTQMLMYNAITISFNSKDCIPDGSFDKKGRFKKVFRKVVNAVVTIVVKVVKNAVPAAALGLVVGAAFSAPVVGLAAGAAFGGFVGFLEGVGDVQKGKVICVLPCREGE